MPRYYFNLRNDIDVRDEEGRVFPDLDTAREWAECEARFEISEGIKRDSRINLDHRIEITDPQRRIIETVFFRDVIQIEGTDPGEEAAPPPLG